MGVFHERLAALGFGSYADYLASPHWQDFKRAYRASGRPMSCVVCGAKPIQLHHHTYQRLGAEDVLDVSPLCREHHVAVHDWLKANGKMVNATHKAVAELGGRPCRHMTPEEGKAFGLWKRDEKRAKKKKRKGKSPRPAGLSAERQRKAREFGPYKEELEHLLRCRAIKLGQFRSAFQAYDVAAAQRFIAEGRARLAAGIEIGPRKKQKRIPRTNRPFQPNARAEPDRASTAWVDYLRRRREGAEKGEPPVSPVHTH
jgi:hypothetical protein